MRTVTKENLIAQIDRLYKIKDEQGQLSMNGEYTLQAYKMLLATMEAEPVAWTSETALSDVACEETSMIGQEGVIGSIPLYRHAQPAPKTEREPIAWLNDAYLAHGVVDGEPVAWDYEWASCITCEGPQDFNRVIEHEAPPEWAVEEGQARNIIPLYRHAQPAPDAIPVSRDIDAGYLSGWNDCRAAMLNK